MASFIYNSCIEDLAKGAIDFDTDTFYVMMTTSDYSPSQAHAKRSDITNEVSGTGYTSGGQEIAVTVSRSTGVTSLTFGTVTFSAPVSGFTPVRGIVYKRRAGAASADELVACLHDASSTAAGGGDYVLTPTSALTITVPQGV